MRRVVLAGAVAVLNCIIWWNTVALGQKRPSTVGETQIVPSRAVDSEDDGDAAILRKLEQPVSLEFTNTPLRDIAQQIAEKYELPLIVDWKALSDSAIDPSTPLSFSGSNSSLKSALRLLLAPLELTTLVDNETLQITSKEVANQKMMTKVYDVSRLLDEQHDPQSVSDIIEHTVAPDTWNNWGGPGSLLVLETTLIATTTREIHREVAQLLEALDKARAQQQTVQGASRFEAVSVSVSPTAKEITRKLNKKIDIDAFEAPLSGIPGHFKELLHCEVRLDDKAMRDAAIDTSTPITFKTKGLSVRATLNLMFSELDFEWFVEDDVLWITTTEVANTKLVVVLYPLADLGARVGYESTVESLKSAVAMSSWHDAGGPASLLAYEPCQCLVVNNTRKAHDQIQSLLAQLREKLRDAPQKDPSQRDDVLLTRVYVAGPLAPDGPTVPAAELVAVVKRYVLPHSWELPDAKPLDGLFGGHDNRKQGSIHSAGQALIVRHTQKAHKEVEKLLQPLGAKPVAVELNGEKSAEGPR